MKICYTSDLAIFAFTLQNIKYAKIISVVVGYNFLNRRNDWEKFTYLLNFHKLVTHENPRYTVYFKET